MIRYEFKCPKCGGDKFRSYEVADGWIRICAFRDCAHQFSGDEDWSRFARVASESTSFKNKEEFEAARSADRMIMKSARQKQLQ